MSQLCADHYFINVVDFVELQIFEAGLSQVVGHLFAGELTASARQLHVNAH